MIVDGADRRCACLVVAIDDGPETAFLETFGGSLAPLFCYFFTVGPTQRQDGPDNVSIPFIATISSYIVEHICNARALPWRVLNALEQALGCLALKGDIILSTRQA